MKSKIHEYLLKKINSMSKINIRLLHFIVVCIVTITSSFTTNSFAQSWNLVGNSGTTAGTNFIGTTDNKDFVFKTNNTEKGRVKSNGLWQFGASFNLAKIDSGGNLSFAGTAAYKVAGNKYAFQYAGNPNYGLFFNSSGLLYEFRTSSALSVFSIGANSGNGIFKGNLKVGAYTLPATDGTVNQVLKTNGAGVLAWSADNGSAYTAGTGIGIVGTVISNTSLNTDAQTLSLAGSTLSISGGNNVTLPTGTTYTAGTGIGIVGTVISNTSLNTDAQTLSLVGSTLSISGGNNVILPTGTTYTAGTGISFSGNTINSKWTATGNDIYNNNASVVGIGGAPTDVSYKLNVVTNGYSGILVTDPGEGYILNCTKTGNGGGVYINKNYTGPDQTSIAAIEAHVNSNNYAIEGYSTNGGFGSLGGFNGVVGTATTGNGVVGNSNSGYGAYGSSVTSTGVYGYSNSGNGTYGSSFTGAGVYGTSNSGFGTYGNSGNNAGVYGNSNSSMGVYGISNTGIGSYGYSNSGMGMRGQSSAQYGNLFTTIYAGGSNGAGSAFSLQGNYDGTGNNDGVGVIGTALGTNANFGLGGYFEGNYLGIYAKGATNGNAALLANSNGATYAIFCSGNFTGTGTNSYSSDAKLKKNVTPISNSLDKIMELKPSSYEFKVGEFGDMFLPSGNHYGLIAQDLQKVFPELVSDNKFYNDDKSSFNYLAVNYQELIPVLISAVQDQQKEIETGISTDAQAQITDLQNENTQLKNEVADIKKSLQDFQSALSQCCSAYQGSTTSGNLNPETASLQQNVPNPFMQSSYIRFYIPSTAKAAYIQVSDTNGKLMKRFENIMAGFGTVTLQSGELTAGTYTYSLFIDGKLIDTKSMILTK